MRKLLVFILAVLVCGAAQAQPLLHISSPAFAPGGPIPAQFSCTGDNTSPPVSWGNVPAGAQSLALIVEDPDAPAGLWTHWVIYNIPPAVSGLEPGLAKSPQLAKVRQGKNSNGKTGYTGPCPPSGTHRYFFRLYALDTVLKLPADQADNAALKAAMNGHILNSAYMMGLYGR